MCWKPSCTGCQPPKGDRSKPLEALLVDSWYDSYLGVVVLLRIIDGELKKGMRVKMMGTGGSYLSTALASRARKRKWWQASARRDRLLHRGDQGSGGHAGGRYGHR
jgi:translation elongation factor EF-4